LNRRGRLYFSAFHFNQLEQLQFPPLVKPPTHLPLYMPSYVMLFMALSSLREANQCSQVAQHFQVDDIDDSGIVCS
jgi:hypothetical protein